MITIKNGQINRKYSMMNNSKLSKENPAKEFAEQLEVDKSIISRRLHTMGKIQKKGE